MNFLEWSSLAAGALLGAMSPGPSLVIVVNHTIRGGASHGVAAAVAHGLGVTLYAVAVVSGLAVVLAASSQLYTTLQWGGAAFLLYLGIKSLTAGRSSPQSGQAQVPASLSQAAFQGLMVAFFNPKLAIFFLALFSQLLDQGASLQQKALMVVTFGAIDGLWYTCASVLLSRPGVLDRVQRGEYWINRVFGVILIALAIPVVLPF